MSTVDLSFNKSSSVCCTCPRIDEQREREGLLLSFKFLYLNGKGPMGACAGYINFLLTSARVD